MHSIIQILKRLQTQLSGRLSTNLRQASKGKWLASLLVGGYALYLLLNLIGFFIAHIDTSSQTLSHEAIAPNSSFMVAPLSALFGLSSLMIPLVFGVFGYRLLIPPQRLLNFASGLLQTVGIVFLLIAMSVFEFLYFYPWFGPLHDYGGGGSGYLFAHSLIFVFGEPITLILTFTTLLFGIYLFLDISFLALCDGIGYALFHYLDAFKRHRSQETHPPESSSVSAPLARGNAASRGNAAPKMDVDVHANFDVEAPAPAPLKSSKRELEKQQPLFEEDTARSYVPPTLDLLESSQDWRESVTSEQEKMQEQAHRLERKLEEFGIECKVERIIPGPIINRFDLIPAPGVKSSKITNVSADLGRVLAVRSLRVIASVPGEPYVGVEVASSKRHIVRMETGIGSKQFDQPNKKLLMMLGLNIAGTPYFLDLAQAPHLLIAGATGMGKSVCINALLISLLYRNSPQDMRLILIDPKQVELSVYAGIPHLLTDVITDMKKSVNALQWCIGEMERRSELLAQLKVRDIRGYNKAVASRGGEQHVSLPYIVIIIDELSDLLITQGKVVETLILRIAQRARAVGIHLIVATQRPSVDVVTGIVKANIPCRIAFKVSQAVDSRTILDSIGAETLLGDGDMLLLPPKESALMRVHGAFISDEEVSTIVQFIRDNNPSCEQLMAVTEESAPTQQEKQDPNSEEEAANGDQKMIQRIQEYLADFDEISVSRIQRDFEIGYPRAARLVEKMERMGILGAAEGSQKRRKVQR